MAKKGNDSRPKAWLEILLLSLIAVPVGVFLIVGCARNGGVEIRARARYWDLTPSVSSISTTSTSMVPWPPLPQELSLA